MKIHIPLLLTLLLVTICKAAPPVEFIITDQEGRSLGTVDIDPSAADEDPNLLDASRIKRSGSPGIFGYIKDGISSKLGQIASASAGAVAHFSGSSSGSGGYGGGYGYGSSYEGKSFDFWTLKKSVLSSLLNAVKAIKGGVLAIKGQLIKGGGNLISAKGRLISMKGEAISNLGKQFISTATFKPAPYHDHYVHPDEIGHGPIVHQVVHHGPAIGAISAPATGYGHISGPGFVPTGHSAPATNYLPIVKPSYGPSLQHVPVYGPPAKPIATYGAPTAPSHNYLPQKFNAALEGNYDGLYDQQHYIQYQ